MDSLQKKDFQWLGALTHELTHLLDFIQYAKLNNLDSYDVIQRDIDHSCYGQNVMQGQKDISLLESMCLAIK